MKPPLAPIFPGVRQGRNGLTIYFNAGVLTLPTVEPTESIHPTVVCKSLSGPIVSWAFRGATRAGLPKGGKVWMLALRFLHVDLKSDLMAAAKNTILNRDMYHNCFLTVKL